jgi:hypothetical protein
MIMLRGMMTTWPFTTMRPPDQTSFGLSISRRSIVPVMLVPVTAPTACAAGEEEKALTARAVRRATLLTNMLDS